MGRRWCYGKADMLRDLKLGTEILYDGGVNI